MRDINGRNADTAESARDYAQQHGVALIPTDMDVSDTNVVSTQRVNRAALPHMRAARDGLLDLGRFVEPPRRHPALSRTVFRGQGR